MKPFSLIVEAIFDLFLQVAPATHFSKNRRPYAFAFLVHPRDFSDIYRKYPFLRALPRFLIEKFALSFWPVVVSKITGLKNQESGEEIKGYVITIAMTARQMIEHRECSLKRIRQAVKLASRKGARIVGLGALTASLTKGGLDLADNPYDVAITTGHAYTAFNITEYVRAVQERFALHKESVHIGIVGAAGSVGSTCAKILARSGYGRITLVDIVRKQERFEALPQELKELNPDITCTSSTEIDSMKACDIIITATNAPEAVVHSAHVRPGTVIIDDAQPSDIAPEVFDREDVIVLEAGAVHTPGVTTNFNMGLQDRYDNFCCLAEVLILASKHWDEHYVLNRATLERVDEIVRWGVPLGFSIGKFQNDREVIPETKLQTIGDIIRARHPHVS